MMKPFDNIQSNLSWVKLLTAISVATVLYSCGNTSAPPGMAQQAMQLPVVPVTTTSATTFREYPASLEGKVNVEIKPQVEGYLEKIYVDEGAWVKAGQPLFRIDARLYNEALNTAKSSLLAAKANVAKAQVDVDRLVPLVENKVISEVQLKTARAVYDAAVAAEEQAKAAISNAQINIGYTLVKAPANGYIGRIPFKTGSSVTKNDALTLLSDIHEMYAYFSLSEPDFIAFKNQFAGNSIEEKVKQVPPVELALADNSIYTVKGKISTIEGQFDKTTGAIGFRATFPNPGGILRTGNTGKIRIPQQYNDALIVPMEATFDVQDKVFVFVLGDSNKVASRPITVVGKTTNYYFVKDGVKAGDKIVFSGVGNLQDGMAIVPQPISADSLLKSKPL
ncbi:efflux RND transporter periplasmic adaptor subunit [Niastella caeni]|uniref:Efflux RND transporter periplasmic adaptor subunit n=1 Tax=Niastella caeni TaxID=2569763 RepID=A0A4S8HB31_9BACT|nr:efflux RND transporter periplasmic adaptor subunit [Niastella caeni]THU31963.1 efflux RND transporter periplasmic adaptor subunit [Niastella caeni]